MPCPKHTKAPSGTPTPQPSEVTADRSLEQGCGPVRLATAGGFPVVNPLDERGSSWQPGPSENQGDKADAGQHMGTSSDDQDLAADPRTLLRLGANGF